MDCMAREELYETENIEGGFVEPLWLHKRTKRIVF